MTFYESVGVSPVINASGRMTSLGGSAITAETARMMAEAGQSYVEINSLHQAVGHKIASLTGFEDAMVTPGAAAGIAYMVAGCIAGTELSRVHALPDSMGQPNEILIQAGHDVNFGAPVRQMISLGGGSTRPVGSVNRVTPDHLYGAISPRTAAVLFVQSHHCVQKGMLSIDECVEICQAMEIPLLIDAAAEEDLSWYACKGATLVTFSGGKAIGGPSSGIVAGTSEYVARCRAQLAGIGRSMKVGKESLAGLLAAVVAYLERDADAESQRQSEIVDELVARFQVIPGLEVVRLPDEAGRNIERVALRFDADRAKRLVEFLRKGEPAIYPRGHFVNTGLITFDPRPLTLSDVSLIAERVREFIGA